MLGKPTALLQAVPNAGKRNICRRFWERNQRVSGFIVGKAVVNRIAEDTAKITRARIRHNKCQAAFKTLIEKRQDHGLHPETIDQLHKYYNAKNGVGGSKLELKGVARIVHEGFMDRVALEESQVSQMP